ncbi:MAG TPA: hypothetical protein VJR89_01390, partial [Polyangiales bacterium]|nr:hypothetical protein [Polyangiales bacterium]
MHRMRALAATASVAACVVALACDDDSTTRHDEHDAGVDASIADAAATDDAPAAASCRFTAELCPDEVSSALQRRRWVYPSRCSADGTPGLTCTVVSFEADGSYHWRTLSADSGGTDRQGKYRAQCSGASAGLMMLGVDSALPFDLRNQQLLLLGGLEMFGAPKSAAEQGDAAVPQPPEQLPERFCELAKEPWVKANHFDLHTFPDRVAFQIDGSAEVGYRAGSCSHGLQWGVMEGKTLLATERNNTCDQRRTKVENRRYEWPIEIDSDGILYLLAEYRRETDPNQSELLRIRTPDLVLSFELAEPLAAGKAIHYTGRVDRRGSGSPVSVELVRARLTPITFRADGNAEQRGESEQLFEQGVHAAVASGRPETF